MNIAIIGTGGVGGYFGAKLAQAGNMVSFLARGEHLKSININGLKIKSIDGDFTVNDIIASDKISSLPQADLIIIGVKAWQIKEIRADIKAIIKPNTVILPMQNGVMAYEELGEVIDPSHILGGLCRILSKIDSPGVINHFGITPTIVFGEMAGGLSPRVEEINNIFKTAGIQSKPSSDIEAELWKKFIGICVSALLAVTKCTYGELRELPETRKMMIQLLEEIYQLAVAKQINIEEDFIEKTVSFIDTFPHSSSSSLTRDVWQGKPSEIEYQNGTVVRLGKTLGIETPVNEFVYNCILPMELKARNS